MTKRLRLVRFTVQPSFVADDGDTLEDVPVQPIVVTAARLDSFADDLRAEMRRLEQELNANVRAE